MRTRRVALLLGAAAVLAALSPAPASALTQVSVGRLNNLLVASPTLESARVDVTLVGTRVSDPGGVRAGEGCVTLSAIAARCSGFSDYLLVGGTRGDRFNVQQVTLSEPGAISGNDGDDVIIKTNPVRQFISGGRGLDLVDYSARASSHGGVTTLGGDATIFNDGQNGSEDALQSIERIRGTDQSDAIDGVTAFPVSPTSSNVLDGEGGKDIVRANRFSAIGQRLIGGTEADTLRGHDGDDVLEAREPADELVARDDLSCGRGFDTAIIDLQDVITGRTAHFDSSGNITHFTLDCEEVQRSAIDEGGTLRILNRQLRRSRGRVALRLHCPRSSKTRCRGLLTISRRGRRLGSRRYRISKGRRTTVKVSVRRRVRDTVLVRARERDSKGRPKTSEKRLRLR